MTPPALIQAQGLRACAGARAVLQDASLSLHPGQLLGIVGPNGAGKTSLLRALLGRLPLRSGQVLLGGQPLHACPLPQRARHMAYLAQSQHVHWPLPAQEVVALGRLPHGDAHRPSGQSAVQAAMQATATLALAQRPVQQLSGGERARVLLARALAAQTPVLLADEPLAALDPAQQLHCMNVLRQQAAQGQGVAVVLHDLALATRFCTHLLLMDTGRSLRSGPPEQVLDAATLASVFGVQAVPVQQADGRSLLPWRVLSTPPGH